MANKYPNRVTVAVNQLPDNAIAITEYCRRNDVDDDRARNMCRAGTFTGALWVPVIKRYMIASDAPIPSMPETSRTKRADGRRPYTFYGTDAEYAALVEWANGNIDGDNITRNPRDRKRNGAQ